MNNGEHPDDALAIGKQCLGVTGSEWWRGWSPLFLGLRAQGQLAEVLGTLVGTARAGSGTPRARSRTSDALGDFPVRGAWPPPAAFGAAAAFGPDSGGMEGVELF